MRGPRLCQGLRHHGSAPRSAAHWSQTPMGCVRTVTGLPHYPVNSVPVQPVNAAPVPLQTILDPQPTAPIPPRLTISILTGLGGESQSSCTKRQDYHTIRYSGKERDIRRALNSLMASVESTKEVMLIVAIAQRNKHTLERFPAACNRLIERLYELRWKLKDRDVLGTISTIFTRLAKYNLRMTWEMHHQGILFAARCRNLTALRRFLLLARADNVPLGPKQLYTLIGKLAVPPGSLQDRANGSWKHEDIMEILTGFKDLTPADACHLEIFASAIRERWDLLRIWITCLSRCRVEEQMAREWEVWMQSPMRRLARLVNSPRASVAGVTVTAKSRGDLWFLHQCLEGGFDELCWRIVGESDIQIGDLTVWNREDLLRREDSLPESNHTARMKLKLWRASMKQELGGLVFKTQDTIAQITVIQSR
ncbi:hypothetical protein P152DRAFT_131915 [Eremomyces bilateralis CBS 781.70]|uniref:Uncharacterized protein n=1 Tax=Eremomyces bilateralis CBS 781.70 TaxID=1392243 RepID=A0A6G1GF01_9PEZI|nr:uncharacterized protein P152DRAFT_131915 [Eremomyces bilateralis CBS 781.70]KAF1816657.1 hypothetical protein P152DRAFT_131915 [Eremomyces bilateralis CBS 781.70]